LVPTPSGGKKDNEKANERKTINIVGEKKRKGENFSVSSRIEQNGGQFK